MGHGPGKGHRDGLSLVEMMRMFPDDEKAREWFEGIFWPDGPICPYCHSRNVQAGIKHKTMTHRCRDCARRPMFSLKTRTVMEGSKVGYQDWAIAIYLLTTSLKSVASMKIHRELKVTQRTAWFLAHRIRRAWEFDDALMGGPVEVDETFVGGKFRNMHKSRREALNEAGEDNKTLVVGLRDRSTNFVKAEVIPNRERPTLHRFIENHVARAAMVYSDDFASYGKLIWHRHRTVNHSAGEYVAGETHTQGIEGFWAMFKRAYKGTFHKISPKHLDRYVTEFAGRHNMRECGTLDQMRLLVEGMRGRRLKYHELTAD